MVATLLIIVAILGYGAAILLGIAGAALSTPGSQFGGSSSFTSLWLVLYSVAMFAGGAYSIRRLWRAPSASNAGMAVFLALVISVAIFGGLSGICTVGLFNIRL